MSEKNNIKQNVNNNIIDIFKFNDKVIKFFKETKNENYSLFVDGVTPHVNYLLTYGTYINNKDNFVYYIVI